MKTKILHIEKLRGISILLVLLFHLEINGFQFGFYGVDVFFVISGFLMASLYGDMATRPEIANYLHRRCARILPAYYVVILIAALCGLFLLLPHEIAMLMEQSLWSAVLLPNIGFWQGAAYFDYTLFRPLLNLWSLGVELQFYLLFPLLLFVERYSKRLLLLIVLLSFLLYGVFSSIDPRNAFFLLPGRIWEFMAGFYACRFAIAEAKQNRTAGTLYLLALLISVPVLPVIGIGNNFVVTCLVVLLSFDMIRHGFTTGSESNLISRGLLLLGKYSYSIYLVHFPIIVFMNYSPFGGTNLASDSLLKLAAIVFLIAVSSVLLHNLVENRTRRALTATGLSVLSLSSIVAVAMLSFIGPMLNLSRFSVEETNISNALLDRDESRCQRSQGLAALLPYSCAVGSSATDTGHQFLLHGDSHADGIKAVLSEVLMREGHGLRITGEFSAVNGTDDYQSVIEEAVGQGSDVIVLHQLPQPDNGAAIADFVEAAQLQGLQVAYIAPVPIYTFDVPNRLIADLGDGMAQVPLGVELQSHLERNKLLFDTLAALDSAFDNFTWYQSANYLCEEYCFISSEEWTPYYFDSNHLTLTGVRLLTPVFESISSL